MASINVDDKIWTDPRFLELVGRCGDAVTAIGSLMFAWKISRDYYKQCSGSVPKPIFMKLKNADHIINSELALDDESGFIYISGSKHYHNYINDKVEAGKRGGIASGVARREIIKEKTKQNEAKRSKTNETQANEAFSLLSSTLNTNTEETSADADCISIIEYFNHVTSKRLTPSKERIDIVKKCFKRGRTPEQLKAAILEFSKDTWADRKKYCDLLYAIGTRNKVDNFDRWYKAPQETKALDYEAYNANLREQNKRAMEEYKQSLTYKENNHGVTSANPSA